MTTTPVAKKHALPVRPAPKRARWRRFMCLVGFHEGPLTIWHHSVDCDACGRQVSD